MKARVNPIVQCVVLIIALCFSMLSSSEIYKWIDEGGRVQFGDRKLEGIKQDVVVPNIQPSRWSRFDIEVKTEDVSISQEDIDDVHTGVNSVYEFYDRVLHFDFYKTVPVKILLLKDRTTYNRYLTKKMGKKPTPTYGMYFPKDNQIIVYMRKDREGTFQTIRHEVSHAIVDTITPYAPAWLNEGLAEQMETLKKEGDELHIEKHKYNHRYVVGLEEKHQLMRAREFLRLPSAKWRHRLGKKGSLQSYAGEFVRFLMSTSPDRSFIVRLMHKFERGDRTISYYLVDENYIGGVRTMEIKWSSWLGSERSRRPLVL